MTVHDGFLHSPHQRSVRLQRALVPGLNPRTGSHFCGGTSAASGGHLTDEGPLLVPTSPAAAGGPSTSRCNFKDRELHRSVLSPRSVRDFRLLRPR